LTNVVLENFGGEECRSWLRAMSERVAALVPAQDHKAVLAMADKGWQNKENGGSYANRSLLSREWNDLTVNQIAVR